MKVTQSSPTLCDRIDCTVHAILQTRILQWVAVPFSRRSSQPRDWNQTSCVTGRFFTSWTTREDTWLKGKEFKHERILVCFPSTNFYTWIQFSSVAQSCLTLRDPMNRSTPGLPVHHQLPEFTQTHVHWVSYAIQHLILCHPLLPPSIFPSIRVFSNESALRVRWPKYWSFSFDISPSNEHAGLISFRMDWLDLLAVQGTLKSLLQLHSSEASILQCSPFFIVQLSHPHMTTEKTIALTRRTFVGKVMSLLLNMLSRLVITFLPRSKRLLISCPFRVLLREVQEKNSNLLGIRQEWELLGLPSKEATYCDLLDCLGGFQQSSRIRTLRMGWWDSGHLCWLAPDLGDSLMKEIVLSSLWYF